MKLQIIALFIAGTTIFSTLAGIASLLAPAPDAAEIRPALAWQRTIDDGGKTGDDGGGNQTDGNSWGG